MSHAQNGGSSARNYSIGPQVFVTTTQQKWISADQHINSEIEKLQNAKLPQI